MKIQDAQTLPVGLHWLVKTLSADLQSLFVDMRSLATLINDASAGYHSKLNAYVFHDTCILLGYRTIHISPLRGPRPTSRLENMIHLGLAVFIMTFLRGLNRKIPNMPLLSNLVRSAAQEHLSGDREHGEMILWILFVGRASIFGDAEDIWLVPKAAKTIRSLGLGSWEAVGETLAMFPWVNDVHDKLGHALWHNSTLFST